MYLSFSALTSHSSNIIGYMASIIEGVCSTDTRYGITKRIPFRLLSMPKHKEREKVSFNISLR